MASSIWLAIDLSRRQTIGKPQAKIETRAKRPLQQVAHPQHELAHVDRTGLEILLARKRQHALRQRGAAASTLHGAIEQAPHPSVRGNALAEQFQVSHYRHEQVVEIVRDAAGELADAFHLLGLQQLLLRMLPRRDLGDQFLGALLDPLFERRCQFGQGRALFRQFGKQVLALELGGLALGDVRRHTDELKYFAAFVASRAGADIDPMDSPARPDGPVFKRQIAAGFHRQADCARHMRQVVRMQAFPEIVHQEFSIRRGAEMMTKTFRGLQGHGFGIERPRPEVTGLQRRLQPLFAFYQFVQPRARIILPAAAAHGSARDAEHGGRMKRPLEKGHVAEYGGQPGSGRVTLRTAAAMGHENDRKIGPWRLIAQNIDERPQIGGGHRLVGNDGDACADCEFVAERL
jgi:hypothetical protein